MQKRYDFYSLTFVGREYINPQMSKFRISFWYPQNYHYFGKESQILVYYWIEQDCSSYIFGAKLTDHVTQFKEITLVDLQRGVITFVRQLIQIIQITVDLWIPKTKSDKCSVMWKMMDIICRCQTIGLNIIYTVENRTKLCGNILTFSSFIWVCCLCSALLILGN